ncbi:hypothetical protein, partial [Rhodoblastus sp.]|uniref:hypothetical protein n=1 Tax=Rhodoblastus sp. TaxID=1962975 RepID=UPI0025DEC100
LTCGEQTLRAERSAQVAGFISEWWPTSNRKHGRLQIGIGGRIESEFAARRASIGKRKTEALNIEAFGSFEVAHLERYEVGSNQLGHGDLHRYYQEADII